MEKNHFQSLSRPILILHGGAGPLARESDAFTERTALLEGIIERCHRDLRKGAPAVQAVAAAVGEMEGCGHFNAGRGGRLQADGMARLSASVMDGARRKFSAVNLVTHVAQPSKLALALQQKEQSVLGPFGAQLLARELGLAPENPSNLLRARQWVDSLAEGGVPSSGSGTVGAVALDLNGNLAAATSTGGCQSNDPERMSDSASVAGNYASPCCAVSCTGMGEQIMNHALAARLDTRISGGLSVARASDLLLREAAGLGYRFGWIAVDAAGGGSICSTTESICYALRHGGPVLRKKAEG